MAQVAPNQSVETTVVDCLGHLEDDRHGQVDGVVLLQSAQCHRQALALDLV